VSFLNAQKIYFVYLQTETAEPFFVRIDDKLYNSTPSGYLILPRLKDSTYNFKLGFPGKNIDLDFHTSINKKDHGYLIKNFGEKGWGLFDLQSLSIQMPSSNAKTAAQYNNNPDVQVNAFTDLLSKATDDPSLKQTPVLVKEQEKKTEAVQTIEKEEKKPEVTEAIVKEEKKSDNPKQPINQEEQKVESVNATDKKVDSAEKKPIVKTGESYKKSQVTKISGISTSEGFESVFIDEYQSGSKDTVRILIPVNKEAVVQDETKPDTAKENKRFLDILPDTDTIRIINEPKPEIKKEEGKKWWPFNKNKTQTPDKPQPETKKEEGKKWWPFNKNKAEEAETKKCMTVAGNDDFLKLRRKMAAKTNDDGMLEEAKKYFKEKCFSTEQIKNLSTMFLSNAGKYNFFDAAYNHVSDIENFSSLESELKDQYYINRFKEIPRN
jgi:hypothetical protein